MTASFVIPAIHGIKQVLSTPSKLNKGFRAGLLNSIEKRLSQYMSKLSYQLATTFPSTHVFSLLIAELIAIQLS